MGKRVWLGGVGEHGWVDTKTVIQRWEDGMEVSRTQNGTNRKHLAKDAC